MDISNSMYRGVYVDKLNHTNYTNYESADFTNLTVTGTGLSGAKTPGIAYAATRSTPAVLGLKIRWLMVLMRLA